jgi:hypothetical protein
MCLNECIDIGLFVKLSLPQRNSFIFIFHELIPLSCSDLKLILRLLSYYFRTDLGVSVTLFFTFIYNCTTYVFFKTIHNLLCSERLCVPLCGEDRKTPSIDNKDPYIHRYHRFIRCTASAKVPVSICNWHGTQFWWNVVIGVFKRWYFGLHSN